MKNSYLSATIRTTLTTAILFAISDMAPEINLVSYEEDDERLKIVIPIRFSWLLFGLYTIGLNVWIGMLLVVLIYLFRGLSSSFILTLILIFWIFVWLWFGRFLSGRWQFYAAKREILFIDEEKLIIRRPVSIFGLTTSYDMQHISQFYFSDRHSCPAFDYAFLHVYFGEGLDRNGGKKLISELNQRYFSGTLAGE